MNLVKWRARVAAADQRLEGVVRRTPMERSAWLSDLCGGEVYLKLENWQRTGSFKFRGATAKLSSLSEDERRRGVIVASSGNHGAASALAARLFSAPARVFVPSYASESKRRKILAEGAELIVFGDDCLDTEKEARRVAETEGLVYVSPYADPEVIAGQGTIGLELLRDAEALDVVIDDVLIAVGGGGLIGGTAVALAAAGSAARCVATSPERSPAFHACLEAQRWVDVPCEDTLSEATAGGLEETSPTLKLGFELIEESLLVPEDQILPALKGLFENEGHLVEGAVGVALAPILKQPERFRDRVAVVVVCGGNVGVETARRILA